MNKKEFTNYISDNFECSQSEADSIINIFSCSVYLAMSEGHNINIDDLGTFSLTHVPEHKVFSRKKGQRITIPERIQPHFKPAKDLKIACSLT